MQFKPKKYATKTFFVQLLKLTNYLDIFVLMTFLLPVYLD